VQAMCHWMARKWNMDPFKQKCILPCSRYTVHPPLCWHPIMRRRIDAFVFSYLSCVFLVVAAPVALPPLLSLLSSPLLSPPLLSSPLLSSPLLSSPLLSPLSSLSSPLPFPFLRYMAARTSVFQCGAPPSILHLVVQPCLHSSIFGSLVR
jgi:hypothetical protein